jgi:ribosomal protein S18 acetylase RimI-like enzyme
MARESLEHATRLRLVDPLLPTDHDLPEPRPGDRELTAPGGTARYRRERHAAEDVAALWGARDQHHLFARLDSWDLGAALNDLMFDWFDAIDRTRPEHDSEALLTWPSRDVEVASAIIGHGMKPRTTLAVRPAGRPVPRGATEVTVRQLREEDVARAVELRMAAQRWDARFGSCVVRPGADGYFTSVYRQRLADRPGWSWVAEDAAGEVRGVLLADPPEHSAWMEPYTSAAAPGYLGLLVVDAEHRGRGIGAALVDAAQAALEQAGADVTLLHYASLNPLSVPFWHRCGYRPLWTTWTKPVEHPSHHL